MDSPTASRTKEGRRGEPADRYRHGGPEEGVQRRSRDQDRRFGVNGLVVSMPDVVQGNMWSPTSTFDAVRPTVGFELEALNDLSRRHKHETMRTCMRIDYVLAAVMLARAPLSSVVLLSLS